MWCYVLISSVVIYACLFIKHVFKVKKCIKNKHVVITGGSSGIGKSLAIECVKLGAHVTIIARDQKKLELAREEILKHCINDKQELWSVSLDVTDPELVEKELKRIDSDFKPIYMLVNCAGMAICGKIEDMPLSDVKTLVNLNFLGTLYPIRIVVPLMKSRNEGIIVLTSSQAGLLGIFGFSVYSASKFALRGLAESLDMEVRPHNISVTINLPPDTDTPGLVNENKGKPLETLLISESGGLFQPDVVAKSILSDALSGKFYSSVGFESYILTTLCCGMSPFLSVFELITQAALLGPLRIISAFFLLNFYNIIEKCRHSKKD